jgi:hypothetical protein
MKTSCNVSIRGIRRAYRVCIGITNDRKGKKVKKRYGIGV